MHQPQAPVQMFIISCFFSECHSAPNITGYSRITLIQKSYYMESIPNFNNLLNLMFYLQYLSFYRINKLNSLRNLSNTFFTFFISIVIRYIFVLLMIFDFFFLYKDSLFTKRIYFFIFYMNFTIIVLN
jgi:hypothetical protein